MWITCITESMKSQWRTAKKQKKPQKTGATATHRQAIGRCILSMRYNHHKEFQWFWYSISTSSVRPFNCPWAIYFRFCTIIQAYPVHGNRKYLKELKTSCIGYKMPVQWQTIYHSRPIFQTWRGTKNSPNKKAVRKIRESLLLWDNWWFSRKVWNVQQVQIFGVRKNGRLL